MDRKYTHENREELLKAIKAAEDLLLEGRARVLELADRCGMQNRSNVALNGEILQLKSIKDEFGIYIAQDNYSQMRTRAVLAVAQTTGEQKRNAIVTVVPSLDVVRQLATQIIAKDGIVFVRMLLGRYKRTTITSLSPEERAGFYEALKLL